MRRSVRLAPSFRLKPGLLEEPINNNYMTEKNKNTKDKNLPPEAGQPRAGKGKKKDELEKKIVFFKKNKKVIRFKSEGSKSKNVKELASLKKNVARILTEINQKIKN